MSGKSNNDYVARRIAEAKIQQYELHQEWVKEQRKKNRIHYTVHTDFNELRKACPTEEEKRHSFDDGEER